MASKFGLAGGIPERRVRPIWDAVDSRQFKAALKLCISLLAKYPNSPYALALKALVLERMGKADEAFSVCLNAREELLSADSLHIDDLTLSTLQIVFQRLDHLDLSTSCYEHACEKSPNNLDLMTGLFNCYVREYAFVKQQQTAIKMYKIVGEERLLLWAVCSIQLQVLCSQGGDKLLSLAEALLRKHIASHSLHEPEALLIYISLLEQQTKYSVALEVISSTLGSLLPTEVDKLRMQGRLLARAGDFALAAEIFQKVICLSPDDWDSFLHYLNCVMEKDSCWPDIKTANQTHISKESDANSLSHLTKDEIECRMSNALAFIEKLQMKVDNVDFRCLYLAKIEIEKRCRLWGRSDGSRLVEFFLEYFNRFSHLACFASDVEAFLDFLNPKEKMDLLGQFMDYSTYSDSSLNSLGNTITLFKLQESFGLMFRLSSKELIDVAKRMVEAYGKNLFLSSVLDPQENVFGEELLSMASNVLVQLFWRTKHFGYMVEAIMILEFGLTIRRCTWQYKVSLLHLYSLLGATSLALDWYKSMEIKNILLESLSHHILPHMLASPFFSQLEHLMKDYLKFMDDYAREAADLTFLAFRHRSYTKAIEFVQFKERLQNSHQYLIMRIEEPILQLKQKANIFAEAECVLESLNGGNYLVELSNVESRSLTFNYDLQSRPWWSPTMDDNYLFSSYAVDPDHGLPRKCKNYPPYEEQDLQKALCKRSLIPRLVYLSITSCSELYSGSTESNGSRIDKVEADFKILLDKYASTLGYPFHEAIKIITEISNSERSFKDFGSDMIYWLNFAILFNAWSCSRPSTISCSALSSSWSIVDGLVKKSSSELLSLVKPVTNSPGSELSILVQLVSETYSWHILVMSSCMKSLPAGKRKKKGGSVDQQHLPLYHALQSSIGTLTVAISDIKKWLLSQLNQSVDSCLDSLISLLGGEGCVSGPGQIIYILEEITSSVKNECGPIISEAVQSWNSVEVLRKMINGQRIFLSEFLNICESKLRLLGSLKIPV